MRIEYISHACLAIEAAGDLLATDPWWETGCYANQWNVFPRPVDTRRVEAADTLVLSHAHADHLHEPTLLSLPGNKRVLFPYYWYGGVPDWLSHMGFDEVVEVRSERTVELGGGSRITYLVCGQDAIMVIEDGDSVLVNVNDALHSASESTIDLYCRRLRRLWPRIDYLFCGFGGASYYPNVFHSPEKDDRAIGRLREEFFVAAFCRIVAALEPRIAVPFAADFVLLEPRQRWMNEVRFPREQIPAYFDAWFRPPASETEILTMYPGDVLDGYSLSTSSPYRERMREGSLEHLIDEQYPEVNSTFAATSHVDAPQAETLVELLATHVTEQAARRPRSAVEGLRFSVHLAGVDAPNWYNMVVGDAGARVERGAEPDPSAEARIYTSYVTLVHSLEQDWGGDDLIIGYGCEVEVPSSAAMARARLATELLVRHPDPKLYARRHPGRMLRYVLQTWFASRAKMLAKLRRNPPADDWVKSGLWLTEDAASLRHRLGLPPPAKS